MKDDPSEILEGEHHPAANSAYRWLKGFMVANAPDYEVCKLAIGLAADSGNRQAQICMGTIERLATGKPVSDRYLLGLAWTILHIQYNEAIEAIASKRHDRAYPLDDTEFKIESGDYAW